jgi:hypothetical protein
MSPDSVFPVRIAFYFEIRRMDQSLMRRFRCFAMLVLVPVAWLIPGTASIAAGTGDKLQSLVNDTAAQVQLAYRQHPDERERRQEQLAAVVAAWRAAPRSEANNEKLAAWLRAAILSSMPGSQEPLPAAPNFVATIKIETRIDAHEPLVKPQATGTTAEKKAPAEAVANPDNDPFRDDPVSVGE